MSTSPKKERPFDFVILPRRVGRWQQGLCGGSARFATLIAMFIHRTTITGCSDRGAWPWRKPMNVRT
jgi:hypothetical protein